jgi:hypothetical protein
MKVYVVLFERRNYESGETNTELVGVFSTEELAEEYVKDYEDLRDGFCGKDFWNDDHYVLEREIDGYVHRT